MKLVGLTGGIGSGKSTVAKMFRGLGVPVYDSDQEAKMLMNTSEELRNGIINLLGKEAYDEIGLNKKYVAAQIFNNKTKLKKINALVHPAVKNHFLNWANQQKADYVIQESALLFENGTHSIFDKVILVVAPEAERLQRVMFRDKVNEKKVRERLRNQLNDEEKIPLSDFIIENVDLLETQQQVKKIHESLSQNNHQNPPK